MGGAYYTYLPRLQGWAKACYDWGIGEPAQAFSHERRSLKLLRGYVMGVCFAADASLGWYMMCEDLAIRALYASKSHLLNIPVLLMALHARTAIMTAACFFHPPRCRPRHWCTPRVCTWSRYEEVSCTEFRRSLKFAPIHCVSARSMFTDDD